MSSAHLDHLGRPVVVVTGMGIVTSLGTGINDNWNALSSGVSGIREITRFDTDGLPTRIAGTVDFIPTVASNAVERSFAFAKVATEEALSTAALNGDFNGPLFLAAPPIEPEWDARFKLADRVSSRDRNKNVYHDFLAAMRERPDAAFHEAALFGAISERMADTFGTRGLPVTISTACASGVTAIQLGVEAIRQGRTNRALCAATEGSISAEALVRFSLLSALSTRNEPPGRASRPFSKDRDGFVFAEGAAVLVLEDMGSALARGARILGVVRGCADKVDSFHRTRSSPDGGPAAATMYAAIRDAGLQPQDIDYINAHGTSTPENDRMEYIAMSAVFGSDLASIPVSSNKSMIGHTISAAGAIEAVFSLQTMLSGTLPPTINYDLPDPTIPLDVVPKIKRDMQTKAIMSNSFGFGGQNASLIVALEPA